MMDFPFPDRKNDQWKYTDLSALRSVELKEPEFSEEDIKKNLQDLIIVDNYLVFINGRYSENYSKYQTSAGLKFEVLTADKNIAVENYFLNLNNEYAGSCLNIEVASNTKISEPYQIIHISRGSESYSVPRLTVNLKQGAEMELIETHSNNSLLTCPFSEYQLAENSGLKVYHLVSGKTGSYFIGHQNAATKRSARFYNYSFNFGSSLVRNNIKGKLQEENSYISLMGLSVLDKEEHADNNTVLDHIAPNCDSYELYKGIYNDKSKGVFNGTIIVEQDAQKTNAIQSNQALLLSTEATSYAQPQLKIWADDVKCTHGATCGEPDEEAMFYLRARGIGKEDAKRIVTEAFAGEVLNAIKNQVVHTWIKERVESKIQ